MYPFKKHYIRKAASLMLLLVQLLWRQTGELSIERRETLGANLPRVVEVVQVIALRWRRGGGAAC